MPAFDRAPIEHNHSYAASPSTSQTTQSSSMPGTIYNAARPPTMGSSPSYNSPVWPTESHQLDLGSLSAPMTTIWHQNSYTPCIPDTSVSLPNTPAPVGLYQSPCQDQASRQMPHLNTPPASAASFSKLGSNNSTSKSQWKVDTGSHGYFKEDGSAIMNKWFGNTTPQIAPPQLYNVPPPTSLSSQDSFNDTSSIASGKKLSATPSRLHPARSDYSSQLSCTSTGDFVSQSPQDGYPTRTRLPNTASPSPNILQNFNIQDGGNHNSPSGATSVAPSIYGSDSNYAASSVQSSQPSRLPSPALSDNQKNAQNTFLVQARAEGMSYKEIKAKGGFTEAESTLRGRHRMLTKDKESRVRKPEWTETDVS